MAARSSNSSFATDRPLKGATQRAFGDHRDVVQYQPYVRREMMTTCVNALHLGGTAEGGVFDSPEIGHSPALVWAKALSFIACEAPASA